MKLYELKEIEDFVKKETLRFCCGFTPSFDSLYEFTDMLAAMVIYRFNYPGLCLNQAFRDGICNSVLKYVDWKRHLDC